MILGKKIGTGNTAEVYEWKDGRVIKLFKRGYPLSAVEKEYANAMLVSSLDFPRPVAYELIWVGERAGIVYSRAEGESLLDWVMKTSDISGCGYYLAELHKRILLHRHPQVPGYKDFLEWGIKKAWLNHADKLKGFLEALEQLPEGDTLCHGDYHPGNVLLSEGKTSVIDFMNICRGPMLYDAARTVYLIEFTPVPEGTENRALVMELKHKLAAAYLSEMGIARESLNAFLSIIAAARAGECPAEFTPER